MAKLSYKVSYYVLYALFAAIIAVVVLFFVGGDAEGAARLTNVDPEIWQPANADFILYLNYALFIIAAIAAVVSFVYFMVCNPKASAGSLYVLAGSIIVLGVCWFLGSPEKVEILGYEGTSNVGFWSQAADMLIYSVYALFAIAVLSIIVGSVKKLLS